ncbi:MAG: hypothetical protein JNN01_07395 [Opitutaceae bacterium]|nr:hypothetical protein [Opitutaceae bacterium]
MIFTSIPWTFDNVNPGALDEVEIEEAVQIGLPVKINFSRPGFSPATVK